MERNYLLAGMERLFKGGKIMYVKVSDRALTLARAPTELNYGQIIMLSHIYSLSENGKCYMTNRAFADMLHTSERTIKRWIQEMKEKKVLEVYYEVDDGRERRVLRVSKLAL